MNEFTVGKAESFGEPWKDVDKLRSFLEEGIKLVDSLDKKLNDSKRPEEKKKLCYDCLWRAYEKYQNLSEKIEEIKVILSSVPDATAALKAITQIMVTGIGQWNITSHCFGLAEKSSGAKKAWSILTNA